MENKRYVPVADGMRALAIAIIALFHYWQQAWVTWSWNFSFGTIDIMPILTTGYIMVDIMLMLSGFLLFLPYAREKTLTPCIATFYRKRAVRIIPGYLFAIFVALFAFAIPTGAISNLGEALHTLMPYLTFTQTFVPDVYLGSALNSVLWTVGVEVQAYILFPLAARAFKDEPWLTYASMLAGGFAYRIFIYQAFPDLTLWINQLPSFLDVYANGMLAAYLYAQWENNYRSHFTSAACTFGSCMGLYLIWRLICWQNSMTWDNTTLHIGQALVRYPLTLIGGAWLILTSFSAKWFRAIFANPVLRWFSGISYAFFLWHQILAVKLREWHIPPYLAAENPQFNREQPWQWQYMIACVVIGIAAAVFSTYCIEKPIAKLLDRKRYPSI